MRWSPRVAPSVIASALGASSLVAPSLVAPSLTVLALVALSLGAPKTAEAFTYKPHGKLVPGSGSGVTSTKDYLPGMRFPIEKAPAYANSQVYGVGGLYGPPGGQCDSANYSYPWGDNYCEKRSWKMPLCPSGIGHQGQDIRPGTCKFNTHWVVATEDGTITSIGTYTVYHKGVSGVMHRYMHMKMSALAVKSGQWVTKGQKLGLVDNDFGGTATSLHLHYDRRGYVDGVGNTYLPTYESLINSYKTLLGGGCSASACSAKNTCGAWSACNATGGVCATAGKRSRVCKKFGCSGGKCVSSDKTEQQSCAIKTDGKQVKAWSAWSACEATGGVCATAGESSRKRQVCKGGKVTDESQSKDCTVKTDGKQVKGWSAWGPCEGFEAPCDEDGTQARARQVCKGGKAVNESQTQACQVDKLGEPVSAWTPWGVCGNRDFPCADTGTRSRSRFVCDEGGQSKETQTEACEMDHEVEQPWGPWSECVADEAPCSETGSQRRTRTWCADGEPKTAVDIQPCVPVCDAPTDASVGAGDASVGGGDVRAANPGVADGCSALGARSPGAAPRWLLVLVVAVGLVCRRRWRVAASRG